jgi:L-cystine uptake protein TcyP (sodium:dicarboxylate symporter family)
MKDLGMYSGCFVGAITEIDKVGSLSAFSWWQIFFIIFLFIIKSIAGGILGALFEGSIKQFKILWNGRTKARKRYLQA